MSLESRGHQVQRPTQEPKGSARERRSKVKEPRQSGPADQCGSGACEVIWKPPAPQQSAVNISAQSARAIN